LQHRDANPDSLSVAESDAISDGDKPWHAHLSLYANARAVWCNADSHGDADGQPRAHRRHGDATQRTDPRTITANTRHEALRRPA
jgi:hypothetical protein